MIITSKTIKSQIYSLEKHAHQSYEEGVPYSVHLILVSNFIQKYIHLIPKSAWEWVICAGWLHDVREDLGISYNKIKTTFGYEVAEMCYCLTNNDGRNRKEKAVNTYGPKTSTNRLALFCKLADRLGNVQYGILKPQGSMLETQASEFDYMVEVLYIKGEYDEMWNELADMLKKPRPDGQSHYTYNGAYFYSKADFKLNSIQEEIKETAQ